MNQKNIYYFVFKLLISFSVLLGPIYSFISFASLNIPEYYYSWFMPVSMIALYTSISFIVFIFIFLICTRFIDKLSNTITVLLSLVITGLTLIYLASTYILEIYILITILSGALFGFTIPVTLKFISKNVFLGQESRVKIITTLIIVIANILIPYLIFNSYGLIYWRLIYLVTGIILVIFTFVLIKFTSKDL
ncbi:MAG: hypothetical protein ACFFFB_03030 [Candidatus Heimdallarchaeota archaeon]